MLANLINDILDYSQIRANKLRLVYQSCEIKQTISEACNLIEIQCKTKGVNLIIEISDDLPNNIETDHNRLTQILLNLLSNSMKFIKKGFIKLIVKWHNKQGRLIYVGVEDTGIGIKEVEKKKLFTDFAKLDLGSDLKLNATGCGLGLSIANKLAVCLGPEDSEGIQVESEEGKGSLFYFIIHDKQKSILIDRFDSKVSLFSIPDSPIPISVVRKLSKIKLLKCTGSTATQLLWGNQSQNQNSLQDIDIPEYQNQPESLSNIAIASTNNFLDLKSSKNFMKFTKDFTILIVDDDLFILESFEKLLLTLGAQVDRASSGSEAINKIIEKNQNAECNKYGIIFMDCNMDDVDGIEATRILKSKMFNGEIQLTPIIGCTGYSSEDNRLLCFEAGMNEVYTKPLSKEKIRDILILFCKNYII